VSEDIYAPLTPEHIHARLVHLYAERQPLLRARRLVGLLGKDVVRLADIDAEIDRLEMVEAVRLNPEAAGKP
jgi:hypothetical protein